MNPYLIVFLGSGHGGALQLCRQCVGTASALRSAFVYQTLTVNIVGSLVMGLLAGYFALRSDPGQDWRLFLTTGIIGGFTTFSAFSLDTALLYQRGELVLAAVYVLASVGVSLGALFAGLVIMRA